MTKKINIEQTDYIVYPDEAKELIKKFLELTIKDYIDPCLQFSPFEQEREHYETAKDFVEGKTAISWGSMYLSIDDVLGIIDVDKDWFTSSLRRQSRRRIIQYSNKKYGKEKKEVYVYVTGDKVPDMWLEGLENRLNTFGIQVYSKKSIQDEIYEQALKDGGEEEARKQMRRYIDLNIGLIDSCDVVIVKWNKFAKISSFLHEIAHAYSRLTPIYVMTTASSVPPLILAYSNKIFCKQEEIITTIINKTSKSRLI